MCFWGIIFFSSPDSLLKFWQESGWVWRTGEIIFLLFMPLGLLDAFVTRTVFTERQIEHRSLFGMKTVESYSSVEKLALGTNFLKIHFVNCRKIKIWRAQGDLEKIVAIIQEREGGAIPIEASL